MAFPGSQTRLIDTATRSLDGPTVARCAQIGLALSALLLASTPLVVADSYSLVENTLSQSGGQGVGGAWVFRVGVVLAGVSVLAMTFDESPVWRAGARRWLRMYAMGLVLLAVFPSSSWEAPGDWVVAKLHTAAAVTGGIAFMIGVVAVSRARPAPVRARRALDWIVVVAVASIPQLMLISAAQGLLQRSMVAVGYVWLIVESSRNVASARRRSAPSGRP